MKKILVVSFRVPYPLTDGAKIRIYNISKILAQKYRTDLLVVDEGTVVEKHVKELRTIFNDIVPYCFRSLQFKTNALKGMLSKDPLQVHYYYFDKVQEWIDRHYMGYDLIFCFHIRTAKYASKMSDKPKVIDFIDATSINYHEAQSKAKGIWKIIYSIENKRLLAYELKMLGDFEKVFITSPFDKAYLDKHSNLPNRNLVVVPNGVREELLMRREFKGREEDWLVFLGKMNYAPNVDAVTYFAQKIFPLVKKKANVKFLIIGTSPAKEVLKLQKIEGIEVTGFVEDPYEYLEKAKVVVVPLRFGAGIQNKVIEALALKKAVVTTTKAARGVEGEDRKHFIIADDEKEMAAKILELLTDEAKRRSLGENARRLVEEKYRWDVIGKKLLKEIEEILNR